MSNESHTTQFGGGQFNTLADNGTSIDRKQVVLLSGKGSDLKDQRSLKGRAKRKLITQKMMLSLIDIAGSKGLASQQKSYWNTYYCQNKLLTSDGRFYGKYCKNRYCTLCCSIRKADIVNRYLPVIKLWPKPYFVTLTVKAIPLRTLHKVMQKMIQGIRRIIQKYRKRSQRNRGKKLLGIRSLECNFNPLKKTYNPHFHLIVSDEQTADILIREWLCLWKSKWTNRQAQHKIKVFNNQTALLETVKYGSKIFTEADLRNKVNLKGSPRIYAAALSNIFDSMRGLRIFERFGFNLPNQPANQPTLHVAKEFDQWQYDSIQFDWLNAGGKKLSDYTPLHALMELLDHAIDHQSE